VLGLLEFPLTLGGGEGAFKRHSLYLRNKIMYLWNICSLYSVLSNKRMELKRWHGCPQHISPLDVSSVIAVLLSQYDAMDV